MHLNFFIFISFYSGDHTESVSIEYDPTAVDYEALLEMFWKNHEITISTTRQYMSAIFYHNEEQRHLAEKTKNEMQNSMARKITTVIQPLETFYDAEK